MQAKLLYDMSDADDRHDFHRAIRASDMACALEDFLGWLRSEIKHCEHTQEEYSLLEKVREKFWDSVNTFDAGQFLGE